MVSTARPIAERADGGPGGDEIAIAGFLPKRRRTRSGAVVPRPMATWSSSAFKQRLGAKPPPRSSCGGHDLFSYFDERESCLVTAEAP
jgi:hypothetical protein